MAKTKPVAVRLTETEIAILDGYAAKTGKNRSEALLHFLHLGLSDETSESPAATKADLDKLKSEVTALKNAQETTARALLEAIEKQPIVVQEAPSLPQPEEQEQRGFLQRLFRRG